MTQDRHPRLERLETAICEQRVFLHRIPDPDTRERAEDHLLKLIEMRDAEAGVFAGVAVGDGL